MNIARYGKSLIKKLLAEAGLELRRHGPEPDVPPATLTAALARLAGRNVDIRSVVDVGASNGCWSKELMKFYPNADYLLIEAQSVHEPELKQFCELHSNARYVLAAAGAEESEIFFDSGDPFGGLASYKPMEGRCVRVPVTTIDSQLKQRNLEPPYLLKLDTHGFELPIFAGAAHCLSNANVLIVECYNFKIAPEAIQFHEMCAYLEKHGFRCADMFDLLYRPYDNSFWQMDILFMKSDRPEFSYAKYR
jgi:FkbM family methyltransferase